MDDPTYGIPREKYIELTTRIVAGLLASGHYTERDEDVGPFPIYKDRAAAYAAVLHAEEIVDEIIDRHDRLTKSISEES